MIMMDSRRQDKWLYIPVEVKVREFKAKTLLACLAAQRGYNVVIGEAHAVRASLHLLPAGIVLEKGVAPSKEESFAKFKHLGNRVAAWCEEGLVFFDDADYVRRKISRDEINNVDTFFAWGKYQADLIARNFPELKNRIVCSGNVRFDLLQQPYREVFSEDAQELRQKHGPFILVNTNFSHCNHRNGENGYVEVLRQAGKLNSAEDEKFTSGWMAHKRRIFNAFIPMIRRIAKEFNDYKIIVRPHPGERYDTYVELFETENNVLVLHEGEVIPWILASSVLIHNGCTTGIEALLLDRPAIAYRPVISNVYDQYLPNSVNFQAEDEDDLLTALNELLNDHAPSRRYVRSEERIEVLSQYLNGFDGVSASGIILDYVDQVASSVKTKNRRPWFFLNSLNYRYYMKLNVLLYKLLSGVAERGEYSKHKFPGVSEKEMLDEVGNIQSVMSLKTELKSYPLTEDVFMVTSADQ